MVSFLQSRLIVIDYKTKRELRAFKVLYIMSATDTAPVPMSLESNKEIDKKRAASLTTYQLPWVEKFRPRTLDDVLGNSETVERLRAIAKEGNVPNLILCGPPGTGKTTSVHALARELLGSSYKNAVLELNASDARGIDVSCRPGRLNFLLHFSHPFHRIVRFLQVVRNQIKSFAMNKVTLPPGR